MITIIDTRDALSGSRHPEKIHRHNSMRPPLPPWLRVRLVAAPEIQQTYSIVREQGVTTVCEEASCPNLNSCWSKRHATMMIMGDICTRGCAFCNVRTGRPGPLNEKEPERVAAAVSKLGLRHVVITSVDRDDLPDGGARHFRKTIEAVRRVATDTTIEILTPDFLRKDGALEEMMAARPDVFNHNLETVPSLYARIRPGARYFHSLRLLQKAKELDCRVITKSGVMLGLGERHEEVLQVMDDLRTANVDILTLGQYLQPTPKHAPIARYVTPDEFERLGRIGYSKGFAVVSASPLTRSSQYAAAEFSQLKNARSLGSTAG